MLKEFKEFAMKGNVMDLAIGVVIGAAFGKIVDSLVSHLINPIVGLLTGGTDFTNKYIVLKAGADFKEGMSFEDAQKHGAMLGWGAFLSAILQFIIVAFVLFLIVKALNKLQKPAAEAAPAGPSEADLLAEIRDLMKAKG
ncbi:MAG: large conductance mechanosensitive channel protein MscL [Fimbriimonadaceae bacterium]